MLEMQNKILKVLNLLPMQDFKDLIKRTEILYEKDDSEFLMDSDPYKWVLKYYFVQLESNVKDNIYKSIKKVLEVNLKLLKEERAEGGEDEVELKEEDEFISISFSE